MHGQSSSGPNCGPILYNESAGIYGQPLVRSIFLGQNRDHISDLHCTTAKVNFATTSNAVYEH